MTPLITKASGHQELFSEAKLRRSLERTHAPADLIEEVVHTIERQLKDGMQTHDIYQTAFQLLSEKRHVSASRYQLKRALMGLGPDGFLFERFVGALIRAEGYEIKIGQIIPGFCVTHEVDVVGKNNQARILVECKFHNHPGTKSDVKTTLYVQARFDDIVKKWKAEPNDSEKFDEIWLVTNTAFTTDAIRYSQCMGMKAIGWNYPSTGSLSTLVERYHLHPITTLTSLSAYIKNRLLEQGILFCAELRTHEPFIKSLTRSVEEWEAIDREINALCSSYPSRL
ncbi:hypothetical protein EBR96_06845 [bacterium]|nr:hypothetical protein [bacterium]